MDLNISSSDSERQIALIADEKDKISHYIQRWEDQVEQYGSAAHSDTGETGLGAVKSVSPETEFMSVQVHEAMKYFRDAVIPARVNKHLPPIMAHGAWIDSLFGPGHRASDKTRNGIIVDGMDSGDFAPFEQYKATGGQGGWWCSYKAPRGKISSDMWILKSNVDKPEFLLVFPDPRTYQYYLQKLDEHVAQGRPVVPHNAMCLAQFIEYISTHGGKIPIEE